MTTYAFTNFASGTLAQDVQPADTVIRLLAGQGNLFPSPAGEDVAPMVLEDVSGNKEVVWLVSRLNDALTVARAQEGTAALEFAANSRAEVRITAAVLQHFDMGSY